MVTGHVWVFFSYDLFSRSFLAEKTIIEDYYLQSTNITKRSSFPANFAFLNGNQYFVIQGRKLRVFRRVWSSLAERSEIHTRWKSGSLPCSKQYFFPASFKQPHFSRREIVIFTNDDWKKEMVVLRNPRWNAFKGIIHLLSKICSFQSFDKTMHLRESSISSKPMSPRLSIN